MTSDHDESDPFVALWLAAPQTESPSLLAAVKRADAAHRRLNLTIVTVLGGIAVLLSFEEATGRLASHGLLTAVWSLGLVLGILWHRRARGRLAGALIGDTTSLLGFVIRRARRGLFLARCLYAGTPLGALAGLVVTNAMGGGGRMVSPGLAFVQTAAGVAALGLMIACGLVLARFQARHLAALEATLKEMARDV